MTKEEMIQYLKQIEKTKKSCFNGQQDGWKNNERTCMIKTKKCTLINITNT